MSSKGTAEERIIHSKSNNMDIMIDHKADEVIEELLNHFFLDIKFD